VYSIIVLTRVVKLALWRYRACAQKQATEGLDEGFQPSNRCRTNIVSFYFLWQVMVENRRSGKDKIFFFFVFFFVYGTPLNDTVLSLGVPPRP